MQRILIVIALALTVSWLLFSCKKTESLQSLADAPIITSVSDSLVAPNATIVLYGKNFSAHSLNNVVILNGIALKVVNGDTHTLYVQMPGSPSSGHLQLSVNGVRAAGLVPYVSITTNRAGGRPVFLGISKPSGTAFHIGDTLTIYGLNLDTLPNPYHALANHVSLGGGVLPVLYASPTRLTVQVAGGAQSGPLTLTLAGITLTGPSLSVVPLPANERLLWATAAARQRSFASAVPDQVNQYVLQSRSDGTSAAGQPVVATFPFSKARRSYQHYPVDTTTPNENLIYGDILPLPAQNRVLYTNPDNGRVGAIHLDNPTVRDTLYQYGVDIADSNAFYFRSFALAIDPQNPDSLLILAGGNGTFIYKGAVGGRNAKQIRQLPNSAYYLAGPFGLQAYPWKFQATAGNYYVGYPLGIYAGSTDDSQFARSILTLKNMLGMCLSAATNTVYWIETSDPWLSSVQALYLRSGTYNGLSPISNIHTLATDTLNSFTYNPYRVPVLYGIGSSGSFPNNYFFGGSYQGVAMAVIPGGSAGAPADRVYWINQGTDGYSSNGVPGNLFMFDAARPNNPPVLILRNAAGFASNTAGVLSSGAQQVLSTLQAIY